MLGTLNQRYRMKSSLFLNDLLHFYMLTDETQDCSMTEQVSICVRYVGDSDEVCEDFMGFVKRADECPKYGRNDYLLFMLSACLH